MKKRICAEISTAEKLREFLSREKIDIEMVTGQPCDIQVIRCNDRRESDLDVIYSGGWIGCETARSMAGKTGISFAQMGTLLNILDVKIRHCSLGCFK